MSDDSQERCGIGIRGVAMAIDTVVWFVFLFAAVYAVAVLTGQVETTPDGTNATLEGGPAALAVALWLGLSIGYHAVLEWRFGKTIGKALVKIRVADEDGARPSLSASLVRNAARLVDWLPAFYAVGIAVIFTSDRRERLGDRLADTAVVRS